MLGISGGIEPIFANSFKRITKSLDGKDVEYVVYPNVVKEYITSYNLKDDSELPDFFVTAQNLSWNNRVDMQATWQRYVDASISSTINLPEDFSKELVRDIYIYAWDSGCKGITIFRDGCKRDSILTTKEKDKQEPSVIKIAETSDALIGKKRKLMTGCGSLHVSAFFDPNTGKLLECFLSKGSAGGCNNFMIGLSRMISLSSRAGIPLSEIVEQMNSTGSCPSYAVRRATKGDTSIGSCCPMAVGKALLEMENEMKKSLGKTIDIESKEDKNSSGLKCPTCGAKLQFTGGCMSCPNCGYSKCD